MRKFFLPAVAAIAPFFLTGCLFTQSYHEIAYYDLAATRLDMSGSLPVLVEPFQSSELLRSQMTYLTGDNRVLIDSYNRWFLPPEQLITRYLQTAFSSGRPALGEISDYRFPLSDGIRLNGNVFTMQIDLKRREAILGVNYSIRLIANGENSLTLSNSGIFSASFHGESPTEFAAAMSRAAEKLALQLQSEIHSLQKQKGVGNHVQTSAAIENNNAD